MKRNEYSIIQTIIDYNYSMRGVASLLKKIHMRGELEYTCELCVKLKVVNWFLTTLLC